MKGAIPMVKKAKDPKDKPQSAEVATARNVLDAIRRIEQEAAERKREQVASLATARDAIVQRMKELENQLAQIDKVTEAATGKPAEEKRGRRKLEEVRGRVMDWLAQSPGRKYPAGDIIQAFPELDGISMSLFLKPLIAESRIGVDQSEGIRRSRYFALILRL